MNRIKETRKAMGITAQKLADLTGLSRNSINSYNHTDPSLANLEKIAKALGVTPAYLAGWEEKPEGKIGITMTRYPSKADLIALKNEIAYASFYLERAKVDLKIVRLGAKTKLEDDYQASDTAFAIDNRIYNALLYIADAHEYMDEIIDSLTDESEE